MQRLLDRQKNKKTDRMKDTHMERHHRYIAADTKSDIQKYGKTEDRQKDSQRERQRQRETQRETERETERERERVCVRVRVYKT